MSAGTVESRLEQITRQEAVFSPLIIEPEGVAIRQEVIAGVPVEWTEPAGGPTDPGLVILYFHGGGYVSGMAKACRRATARLALGTGGRVLCPDYGLAPVHPFPTAHEDVLGIYRHLIGEGGFDARRIVAAGDSAGGSIALSLIADARDAGLPMPACGMLNSPYSDIALHTPSLDDPVKNQHEIKRALVEYLSTTFLSTGGVDPMDPRHSPVYRDMRGLPPLLVQAAGRDVCHDDAVRIAANARAAGVPVQFTEYPEAEHIWIVNGPCAYIQGQGFKDTGKEPPASAAAVEEMCAFLKQHVG